MHESEVVEILSSNETFSAASLDVLSKMIESGEMKEFSPGEDIVEQGVTGRWIWVLLDGELAVLVDGEEVNRVAGRGQVFGEISAVSFTPATATVRALTPAKATGISHQVLHRAMEQSPELAAALLRSMAKYLEGK